MEENKLIKVKKNKYYVLIVLIIILIVLDQFTKFHILNNNIDNKSIIPNILNINYIRNTGGAFGVGQGNIATFIISNIVVLGIIIRFMIIQRDRIDLKTNIMLSFILAGGLSNLIDRIFRGFVIDFINLFPTINFPKFNLADIYIVMGWIILAIIFATYTMKEIIIKKKSKNE